MNKTENAIAIVKQSLLFDKDLRNNNNCDLRKKNDIIKSYLQTLMWLSDNDHDDAEILELCKLLYNLNESIIKILESSQASIMLFFYKDGCKPSTSFVSEWKILQKNVGNRSKFIAINCSKEKYFDVCNKFGIYQYPTIKYICNDKVHDYFGEMTAAGIQREFFKIL